VLNSARTQHDVIAMVFWKTKWHSGTLSRSKLGSRPLLLATMEQHITVAVGEIWVEKGR